MDDYCRQLWLRAFDLTGLRDREKDVITEKSTLTLSADELNQELNKIYPVPPSIKLTYDYFKHELMFRSMRPPLLYHLLTLQMIVVEWMKLGNTRLVSEIYKRNPHFAMWNDFTYFDASMFMQFVCAIPLKLDAFAHLKALGCDEVNMKNAEEDGHFQFRWSHFISTVRSATDKRGVKIEDEIEKTEDKKTEDKKTEE